MNVQRKSKFEFAFTWTTAARTSFFKIGFLDLVFSWEMKAGRGEGESGCGEWFSDWVSGLISTPKMMAAPSILQPLLRSYRRRFRRCESTLTFLKHQFTGWRERISVLGFPIPVVQEKRVEYPRIGDTLIAASIANTQSSPLIKILIGPSRNWGFYPFHNASGLPKTGICSSGELGGIR